MSKITNGLLSRVLGKRFSNLSFGLFVNNFLRQHLSFVDPTTIVRVNALQQIMMCFCKLTMTQVLSIVAGSLTRTRLKKVRWTAVELDGTSMEWQVLHKLFYEASSLGIPIFQDTRCPCIENMHRKYEFQYTCT